MTSNENIHRGSLTEKYQQGYNHACAFVAAQPPADQQGRWLYLNGYTDGAKSDQVQKAVKALQTCSGNGEWV
jgi:hypothetical protein